MSWRANYVSPWRRECANSTAQNIDTIQGEIHALHQFGVYVLDSPISAALAQIFLAAEDVGRADAVLDEAIAFAEQSGERYWLAELHRLRGEWHRGEPPRIWPNAASKTQSR